MSLFYFSERSFNASLYIHVYIICLLNLRHNRAWSTQSYTYDWNLFHVQLAFPRMRTRIDTISKYVHLCLDFKGCMASLYLWSLKVSLRVEGIDARFRIVGGVDTFHGPPTSWQIKRLARVLDLSDSQKFLFDGKELMFSFWIAEGPQVKFRGTCVFTLFTPEKAHKPISNCKCGHHHIFKS